MTTTEEVRRADTIQAGELIDALPLVTRFGLAADMLGAEYEYALVERVASGEGRVLIFTNTGSWALPNDYSIIVLTEMED